MRVAKTKALISFAVTAKLICVFVFAYAKSRFSHNEAHLKHKQCLMRVNLNRHFTVPCCIKFQGKARFTFVGEGRNVQEMEPISYTEVSITD